MDLKHVKMGEFNKYTNRQVWTSFILEFYCHYDGSIIIIIIYLGYLIIIDINPFSG